jgi:two-component system uhpT operon response regulator UhpA
VTDRGSATARAIPRVVPPRQAGPGELVVQHVPVDSALIRLAIVDEHRLMLDGLQMWLAAEADDVQVDIAVSSWRDLLAHSEYPVDVALLDLDLEDDVPMGAKIVRLVRSGVAVVVISTFVDPRRVRECVAAGALGYVSKREDTTEILRSVRAAAAGESRVSAVVAALLATDEGAEPPPALSPQERRALVLYASGLPLKGVAEHLDISVETAKTYLSRVREKYALAGREARTKIALHRRAVEDGLIASTAVPEERPTE